MSDDKVLLVTTHKEVQDYFYAPTGWDNEAGDMSHAVVLLASWKYKWSDSKFERLQPILGFADDSLEEHWDALYNTPNYVCFNFETGEEWSEDDEYERRRPVDDPYLTVAKKLVADGFDKYDFSFTEEDCSIIVITKRSTGATFRIKDTVDFRMYKCLEKKLEDMESKVYISDVQQELQMFLKEEQNGD